VPLPDTYEAVDDGVVLRVIVGVPPEVLTVTVSDICIVIVTVAATPMVPEDIDVRDVTVGATFS